MISVTAVISFSLDVNGGGADALSDAAAVRVCEESE